MDILITNATIITQNAKREILNCDIFISENKIEKIGKNLKENAEEKINGKGKLIFPGLINTHTHIPMTLFRGYGEDMQLQEWLTQKIWPAEEKLTPKNIYWGALLGIAEMIRSGTTAFNEMYVLGLKEIAQATEKGGVRASIGLGMIDKISGRQTEIELSSSIKFISELNNKRVCPVMACHASYTCSSELIRKAKEYAKKKNLQFHMHASETRKEVFDILKETGKRPLEYFNELEVLDEKTVLAHAVFVSEREIILAGKTKTNISHNPVSNLKLASGGFCPVSEFMHAGANVTLGTDGAASNNSLNMIETMKFAALLQKNHYWDPRVLSAHQVLDFATINGAKALGIDAGSIEEGKLADIVIADLNAPNLAPVHNYFANVVYAMNPSNITDVIVNGEFVMREKKIVTFDEENAIEKASAAAQETLNLISM